MYIESYFVELIIIILTQLDLNMGALIERKYTLIFKLQSKYLVTTTHAFQSQSTTSPCSPLLDLLGY
jgi:hypothetical protein